MTLFRLMKNPMLANFVEKNFKNEPFLDEAFGKALSIDSMYIQIQTMYKIGIQII